MKFEWQGWRLYCKRKGIDTHGKTARASDRYGPVCFLITRPSVRVAARCEALLFIQYCTELCSLSLAVPFLATPEARTLNCPTFEYCRKESVPSCSTTIVPSAFCARRLLRLIMPPAGARGVCLSIDLPGGYAEGHVRKVATSSKDASATAGSDPAHFPSPPPSPTSTFKRAALHMSKLRDLKARANEVHSALMRVGSPVPRVRDGCSQGVVASQPTRMGEGSGIGRRLGPPSLRTSSSASTFGRPSSPLSFSRGRPARFSHEAQQPPSSAVRPSARKFGSAVDSGAAPDFSGIASWRTRSPQRAPPGGNPIVASPAVTSTFTPPSRDAPASEQQQQQHHDATLSRSAFPYATAIAHASASPLRSYSPSYSTSPLRPADLRRALQRPTTAAAACARSTAAWAAAWGATAASEAKGGVRRPCGSLLPSTAPGGGFVARRNGGSFSSGALHAEARRHSRVAVHTNAEITSSRAARPWTGGSTMSPPNHLSLAIKGMMRGQPAAGGGLRVGPAMSQQQHTQPLLVPRLHTVAQPLSGQPTSRRQEQQQQQQQQQQQPRPPVPNRVRPSTSPASRRAIEAEETVTRVTPSPIRSAALFGGGVDAASAASSANRRPQTAAAASPSRASAAFPGGPRRLFADVTGSWGRAPMQW